MARIENPPRKPYVARGSGVKRCDACRLPDRACICEYRESFSADVEFWLLTHAYETYKPTNTGRLIRACLPDTKEIIWHSRTDPGEVLGALLDDERYQPILIFPESDDYVARMIDKPAGPESGRKPALIILDGTWRQARRMFRHSTYLQHLPVMSLHRGRPSSYALRKSLHENQLCTAEVAIAMLEQLDQQSAADGLEAYFDRFNRHYIATRRRWANRDSETGQVLEG